MLPGALRNPTRQGILATPDSTYEWRSFGEHVKATVIAVTARQEIIGLVTLRTEGTACELLTIDSFQPANGVGTALLSAAIEFCRERQLSRLWLVTTNDNLNALRFYQKRGLKLTHLYPDAVTR